MTNIVEDMQWRYACKKFDPAKKLTEEQVNALLESMRLTASSYGLQPWCFVRVKNTELREGLVAHCYNQAQVKDASDLFVLCAKTDLTEADVDAYIDDTVNKRSLEKSSLEGFKKMMMYSIKWPDEKKKTWMDKQLYIALGTLMSACAMMRIDSCPMEGFVPSKVDELLNLKEMGLRSVLLCPVGYRADDDAYAKLAKVRFDSEQVIKTLS